MRKILPQIFVVLAGLLFFGVGAYIMASSQKTVSNGKEAMGKVVDIESRRGSKGKVYAPVIEYATPDGVMHRFTSRFASSNYPSIGSSETIIYDPANPSEALEKSFFQMYVFPGIFMFSGLLVIFLGIILPWLMIYRQKMKATRLRTTGVSIQAKIIGASKTGLIVNNKPYYAISAQWLDPSTNLAHVFKSASMPFDPSSSIKVDQTITVYINPSNPKDYWMDTSFVPTLQ
jgi:hypothetical protein